MNVQDANLEGLAVDICRLWRADKADKQVFAKVLWCGHLQEDVNEDLESSKIDFLIYKSM